MTKVSPREVENETVGKPRRQQLHHVLVLHQDSQCNTAM